MTCITYFLDIPIFAMSLLTITSSTYFIWYSDSNVSLFVGKAFSYLIVFLTFLCKTLNIVCLGTRSNPNPKQASPQCPLKDGYPLFTTAFLSHVQFSSVHQLFLCFFAAGLYSATLTVAMSCGTNNSDPASMGINYQYPTAKFSQTITFLWFICSLYLAF